MREQIIKILSNISNDYTGTVTLIERLIEEKQDDAVKVYIQTNGGDLRK